MNSDYKRLIATADGSLTLRDEETRELYHNDAGAYSEALKNYVEPAAAVDLLREQGELWLLDACFGLGYNTFTAVDHIMRSNVCGVVHILAIELDAQILSFVPAVLDYEPLSRLKQVLDFVPTFGDFSFVWANCQFKIKLCQGDLRQLIPGISESFDLVFHDPFSPRKVPELWSLELFKQYYRLTDKKSGKLLTYSLAPAVLGGLKAAGFELAQTAAVGGKKGGLLAYHPGALLRWQFSQKISAELWNKLASASGLPYRDEGLQSTREAIFERRALEQKRFAAPSRD